MSWINKLVVACILGGVVILFVSLQTKSFALLSLSVTLVMLAVTVKMQSVRRFALPATAVALIITIAEPAIGLFLPDNHAMTEPARFTPLFPNTQSDHASRGYFQTIPGFGFRPTPGTHSGSKRTSTGEVIYDVVYTIGPDGYRADVTADRYDAYIYGGSFTFGEGLNDDETLSFFLKKNHNILAKNVSGHGYGLHQALYNIQHGVTSIEPDGVNILLTAPWHSLRSSCKPRYASGTPRYIIVNGTLTREGVCKRKSSTPRILTNSNIYKLFKLALANNENVITDSDMELYIEIIKEIKKLSEQNEALLVIAYIKATDEQLSSTRWTNESLYNELQEIADVVVDVTLAETTEELEPKFYIHELDQHPSSLANEYRAEILSRTFE